MKKLLFISLILCSFLLKSQSISWPTDRPGNVNAFDNLSKNALGIQFGLSTPLKGATNFSAGIPLSDAQVRWGLFDNIEIGTGVSFSLIPQLNTANSELNWGFNDDVGLYLETRIKLPEINSYHHNLHIKGGKNIPLQLFYNFGFTFSEHFIIATSLSGYYNTETGFIRGAVFNDNFGVNGIVNLAYQYDSFLYYAEIFSAGWQNSWFPGGDIGIAYSLNEKTQLDAYIGIQSDGSKDFSTTTTLAAGIGISYGIF